MIRFAIALLVGSLCIGCAATQPVQVSQNQPVVEYQPPPTADPVWYPEPVVQSEIPGARGNGRYRVGDAVYSTWHNVDSYIAEGTASWRGREFDGRTTISGEEYDVDTLSAAHRHLPIPSYLRITNLANGLATIVRVNDRGPFFGGHLVDVSEATAMRLGFGNVKWRPVRVELVSEPTFRYVLETNYLYGRTAAETVLERLSEINLGHLKVSIVPHQYENRYRVKIGDFANIEDANFVSNWLAEQVQLKSSIIRE